MDTQLVLEWSWKVRCVVCIGFLPKEKGLKVMPTIKFEIFTGDAGDLRLGRNHVENRDGELAEEHRCFIHRIPICSKKIFQNCPLNRKKNKSSEEKILV